MARGSTYLEEVEVTDHSVFQNLYPAVASHAPGLHGILQRKCVMCFLGACVCHESFVERVCHEKMRILFKTRIYLYFLSVAICCPI